MAYGNHEIEAAHPSHLLTEKDAARHLRLSIKTLQNWRVRRYGPPFLKLSNRAVRYRFADLIEWTESRIQSTTLDLEGNDNVR